MAPKYKAALEAVGHLKEQKDFLCCQLMNEYNLFKKVFDKIEYKKYLEY